MAQEHKALPELLQRIRACTLCAAHLPCGPRPVLQADARARVLVVGQAPGRRVHDTGLAFNDPSGERLRAWTGLVPEVFYDPTQVALLPMGFCFPGTGPSGDLPPRPECAPTWRAQLLGELTQVQLTLVIGQYALAWHLPRHRGTLTDAVRANPYGNGTLWVLPHPSPRNNRWLARNPWFERDMVGELRTHIARCLIPFPNHS